MAFVKFDLHCPVCHGDGCYEIDTYDGHRSDTTYVQCQRCEKLFNEMLAKAIIQVTTQKIENALRADDV